MPELKNYMTAEQVAPKIGYTVTYLLKLCQAGRFPHIRLNKKKKLFDPDDVQAFIEARKVEPTWRSRR